MSIGLGQRLRDGTRALHTEAERTGLMLNLLRGPLQRSDYIALLRNLHAIYDALEQGLDRHAAHPALALLPLPELARRESLSGDLLQLHGVDWSRLPLAPAAQQYALHLHTLADERPLCLAAHAYVRYLGDLNGGQVLRRVVAERLTLAPGEAVGFYDFGTVSEVTRLSQQFRGALEGLAADEDQADALVLEACNGFRRHKHLFEQLAPTTD